MKTFLLITVFLLPAFIIKAQYTPCTAGTAYDSLNINNVNARLNIGDMWRNITTGNGAYEVPGGSGQNYLFAGSLWIGGFDSAGKLHIAANTFRQNGVDFYPGPILDSTGGNETECASFDRFWKVTGKDIRAFDSIYSANNGHITASQIPADILNWPASGNPNNPLVTDINQPMAPFYDNGGSGIYDPTLGDQPGIGRTAYPYAYADEMLWWCYNDNGNVHGQTKGLPLNVEIHVLAYAYNSIPILRNTTFYQFTIWDKGVQLDSVYIGLWADPGITCSNGVYVGCDSTKSTAFIYPNSTGETTCTDSLGGKVPITAIDILQGPTVANVNGMDDSITHMSHFMTYNNDVSADGNPQKTIDYYNYMRNIFTDGTHSTYGGNGYGGTSATNFMFPGNPADASQWSMCSANLPASAPRMILSTYADVLLPGAISIFTLAVIWDTIQPGSPCISSSPIASIIDSVKALYLSGPTPPNLGIQNVKQQGGQIKIYPSIIKQGDSFTVFSSAFARINVIDVTGRTVESATLHDAEKTISISTKDWMQGIYFCRAEDKRGQIETQKIIVQ